MSLENYEDFDENQLKILERYVTNTQSHIFVLKNLPEVIKGALFSRYSRSNLGLRSLLLKEFVSNNDESGFASVVGYNDNEKDKEDQTACTTRFNTAHSYMYMPTIGSSRRASALPRGDAHADPRTVH